MKYRYITAPCNPKDEICRFRLISHREIGKHTHFPGKKIYRVKIPADLKLKKWSCDVYATTEDTRTIESLGYDVIVVMWNGVKKVVCKGVDVDAFAEKQNKKWTRCLFQNPKEAYHPFENTEDAEMVSLGERFQAVLLNKTINNKSEE